MCRLLDWRQWGNLIGSVSIYLLRGGAPPPPRRVGPHPHALPAPRFARRRWLEARSRLDQLSVRHSDQIADPSGPVPLTTGASEASAGSAWGWGPTRFRGGGAPRNKQVMLTEPPNHPTVGLCENARLRMAELLPLSEAIARFVRSGDSVALEGFTHLIPFAAGHEIIRQQLTDLTLIRMTPDLIYDQMIGCGCARKLVFSWGGNPGVGSLHRLRDAVERGWPKPLEIEEHSHSAMAHAYAAGASGLPCAVFRGYQGSDLRACQPADQGDHLPVHGRGPHRGSGAAAGCRGRFTRRRPIARATCSSPASSACRRKPCSRRRAPSRRWRRSSTTSARPGRMRRCSPRGRSLPSRSRPAAPRPSYAHGYYGRDNAFYTEWDAIARDRDTFGRWIDEHVRNRMEAVR